MDLQNVVYLMFLAMLSSAGWSTSLVQTEILQQLSDGRQYNFVQIFVVSRG